MFIAKRIEIDMGHELIVVLLEEDAKKLCLHPKERIKIITSNGKKNVTCKLEVIDYKRKKNVSRDMNLKSGEIGIFEKAFDKLEIVENKTVNIVPANKPKSMEFVKKKFDGGRLNKNEFKTIVKDIFENIYSDIETTFFVIACTAHPLNDKETTCLTEAMVDVGKVLDFKTKMSDIVVDKHCIGGVPGNRTSMIVVPIIASANLIIPKTSSRAITSPAGTADTMEVLANVHVPLTDMFNEVKALNGCIVWGGALDLSPADDLIIEVEHPLELDSEGQMIASILSKKKSAGATHVLIDIPVGKTAKVKDYEHGEHLKKRFEKIGRAVGLKIQVIITDGSSPIGKGIGPLYEALDVMKILKNENDACVALREKSLYMAGLILEMSGQVKKGEGYSIAKEILASGRAYDKFDEILVMQGKKEIMPKAKYSEKIKVEDNSNGKIVEIDNKRISKLAFILGAPQDKAAGMILNKKKGDVVKSGDELFEMFSNSSLKLKYAKTYIKEHQIFKLLNK